jgi:hypothetical protein
MVRDICKLCQFVLARGIVDPISATALAKIVTVTTEDRLQKVDIGQQAIINLLNEWHDVWGQILADTMLFRN